MLKNRWGLFVLLASLLTSACNDAPSQVQAVEVTRMVLKPYLATAEVTRIVFKEEIVTREVTRIVRETVLVPIEPQRELAVETPAPTAVIPVTAPTLIREYPVAIHQGPDLSPPRFSHTATRLLDGKILLVGGSRARDVFTNQVEIVDPVNAINQEAAPLHTARHDHTATLLMDGRVLVLGGYTLPQQWIKDAEIYDPVSNTWTVIQPLYPHGTIHTATVLKDGRVLVVGGCIDSGVCTDRVELFNPYTNAWENASPLGYDLSGHTAHLLDNGRVLVSGGVTSAHGLAPANGTALLYDPQTNQWMLTGPMVQPRFLGQSVQLADRRILVAGGFAIGNQPMPYYLPLTSAEMYDPTSNAWTATADLAQGRYSYTLFTLTNGKILAIGGGRIWDTYWTENSFVREIELYDPASNRWETAGTWDGPGVNAAAVALPDGRVWVTGGQNYRDVTPSTWVMSVRW